MTTHYNLRLNAIFLLFLILFGILCTNLYVIQVKQSDFFKSIARNQYTTVITTTPPRAEIFDRNLKPLAINTQSLTAFTIPSKHKDSAELKSFLKKKFPQASVRLQKNPESHFMYIKRHLTPKEAQLIEKNNLDEIRILKEPSRYYPSDSFGPLIGITDIDNKGQFGIELQYESFLAGKPSTYFLEQDARSGHYYFNKETKVHGSEGSPITLTLDASLQYLAYEELRDSVASYQALEGAVLIIDPTNGDILVMAQYPDFDPNHHGSLDLEKTKNKVVTETYELGSVMKIFLALAALEEKIVSLDELIDCEDKKVTYIDGIRIGTFAPHGILTFSQIIELSNNIGTSKISQRLGKKLYDHLLKCGFGKKTNLSFPGEQKGYVNHPSLWSRQSVFSLSFGYESRATLLQLARGFSVLANNGSYIEPRLIMTKNSPILSPQMYSSQTVDTLRNILEKTIEQGTAKKARIAGYKILGKTGTANLLTNGKYDPTRNIYTFAGLVEKDNYKRIIITFIKETPDRKKTASTTAAPLFERIAHKMLIRDKII